MMSLRKVCVAYTSQSANRCLKRNALFIHHRIRPDFTRRRGMTTTTKTAADEEFKKSYSLTGQTLPKNKSGVTVSTNTGHTLSSDVPQKMGGKDSAPQPVELLLTSLIGCTQATALFVSRQMGMKDPSRRFVLDRLEFTVHAIRDERGALHLPIDENPPIPARLASISGQVVVYTVNNKPINADQLELLKEQTELRCPIANMIMASGCNLDIEWIDGYSTLA